jgi:hypothetical protein
MAVVVQDVGVHHFLLAGLQDDFEWRHQAIGNQPTTNRQSVVDAMTNVTNPVHAITAVRLLSIAQGQSQT